MMYGMGAPFSVLSAAQKRGERLHILYLTESRKSIERGRFTKMFHVKQNHGGNQEVFHVKHFRGRNDAKEADTGESGTVDRAVAAGARHGTRERAVRKRKSRSPERTGEERAGLQFYVQVECGRSPAVKCGKAKSARRQNARCAAPPK